MGHPCSPANSPLLKLETGAGCFVTQLSLPPLRTFFKFKHHYFPFMSLRLFSKKTITHSWSINDLLIWRGLGDSWVLREHAFLFK